RRSSDLAAVGGSGNVRRFGRPEYFQVIKFKVGIQPLGCIGDAVGFPASCGNAFQSFWLYRPPYDIRDVAPEVRKHPAAVVQEMPVGYMAAFREVIGVWRRTQPHVPVECRGRGLRLRMSKARREAGLPQAHGVYLSDCTGLYDLDNPMVVVGSMDLRAELKDALVLV